ncbi:MAG: sigma-70 family RNA polymerase sigma factor [Methylococcaceae bacterium]
MNKDLLTTHRLILLRYALLQLQDESIAEDVVQETLLTALQTGDNFRYESAIRTWLIGILKHKIADYYRGVEKHYLLDEETSENEADPNEALEQLIFNGKGHWIGSPSAWHNPDHALEQSEFWIIFEWCQKNLPQQHARAFMLRELVGLEMAEICQDMTITPSACRVYLHRARLGLRECLQQHWFNTENE